MQYTLLAAREIGIRGIVFNPRGIADSPVLTPKMYSASYTGDFRYVLCLMPGSGRLEEGERRAVINEGLRTVAIGAIHLSRQNYWRGRTRKGKAVL